MFEIQLNPVAGWTSTLALSALLILTALLGYRSQLQRFSKPRRWTLLGIRLATALALIFGLLRPSVVIDESDDGQMVVAILTDSSKSMTTTDGPGGITRREHLLEVLQNASGQLEELAEHVEIRRFDFSTQTYPIGDEYTPAAEGEQTAIGNTLNRLVEEVEGTKLLATWLLSDGAQRAVNPFDADPRVAAQDLARKSSPLFTVPFGATSTTTGILDLAVEDVGVDPVVFEKKRVPINTVIRVSGAANRTLQVRLLREDLTGKGRFESGPLIPVEGSMGDTTEITLQPDKNLQEIPVELTFTPEIAGEMKLAVEVIPLDEEVVTRNNIKAALTSVRAGGLKTAYFDVLRSELKFIRKLNRSEKIQIDFQLVLSGAFAGRTSIETSWFERGAYDVYIIGDVPAKTFSPEQLNMLAQRLREGAGLIMLGGYHNYAAGGYGSTPLAEFLPVALPRGAVVADGRIDEANHIFGDIQIVPTDAGLRHYVMRIDSLDQNQQTWQSLPVMTGVNRLEPKNDFVEILARTGEGDPALMAIETGRSRVVASAMDETFLWVLGGYSDVHQRFWRQMILWLAHKEIEQDQAVWVNANPRIVAPTEPIELEFGARDEAGNPLTDVNYKVSLKGPEGKSESLTVQRLAEGGRSEWTSTEQPGDYWVTVEGTREGKSLGAPATLRVIVEDVDLELDNPTANPLLLSELAEITAETSEGRLIPPEELTSFLDEFLEREPWKLEVNATKRTQLWDSPWLLGIFLLLLTTEWFLRKRWQLV